MNAAQKTLLDKSRIKPWEPLLWIVVLASMLWRTGTARGEIAVGGSS